MSECPWWSPYRISHISLSAVNNAYVMAIELGRLWWIFQQDSTGGAMCGGAWWLSDTMVAMLVLSVCCLPAVEASLSPSLSLMGNSGIEEIMIHAFNWCLLWRTSEMCASLLVHWLQHTEIAVSCCCLCGEMCQCVCGLNCLFTYYTFCRNTEDMVTFRLG